MVKDQSVRMRRDEPLPAGILAESPPQERGGFCLWSILETLQKAMRYLKPVLVAQFQVLAAGVWETWSAAGDAAGAISGN